MALMMMVVGWRDSKTLAHHILRQQSGNVPPLNTRRSRKTIHTSSLSFEDLFGQRDRFVPVDGRVVGNVDGQDKNNIAMPDGQRVIRFSPTCRIAHSVKKRHKGQTQKRHKGQTQNIKMTPNYNWCLTKLSIRYNLYLLRIIKEQFLMAAAPANSKAGKWLETWRITVRVAEWRCIDDVRKTYENKTSPQLLRDAHGLRWALPRVPSPPHS